MKTDVKEKDGMYTQEMDLPGYEKSDIKAELNNGYLTISASKDSGEQEKKDEESGYVCRERYTGQCSRSFYVGDSVKEEDIKAGYNNGILTLNFRRKRRLRFRKRNISRSNNGKRTIPGLPDPAGVRGRWRKPFPEDNTKTVKFLLITHNIINLRKAAPDLPTIRCGFLYEMNRAEQNESPVR